jgi:hypothetical protein
MDCAALESSAVHETAPAWRCFQLSGKLSIKLSGS